MDRRNFLLDLSIVVPAAAAVGFGPRASHAWAKSAASADWRIFEITTSVRVANPVGRTQLWLPLPWSQSTPYQRSLDTRWDAAGSARAELTNLSGYDVALLRVEWSDAQSVGPVSLINRVATRDRGIDLSAPASAGAPPETPTTLQAYLRPTALLPTDGIVRQTAEKITRGRHGDLERARAIYEWVVDNTNRDPKTPGCGLGDVAAMLKSGYLGGKCADINALFVALARAVKIPARDAYGVRVADSRLGFKSLGRSGDISKAQHCRAEFYAQGHGWIPVDPADVRKVVLEETPGGLPLDDPKVQAARAALFGSWEMNWIAYNHGHDVELPGSRQGAVAFLMYPNGDRAEARLNCLDPAAFHYEIHSREVTA